MPTSDIGTDSEEETAESSARHREVDAPIELPREHRGGLSLGESDRLLWKLRRRNAHVRARGAGKLFAYGATCLPFAWNATIGVVALMLVEDGAVPVLALALTLILGDPFSTGTSYWLWLRGVDYSEQARQALKSFFVAAWLPRVTVTVAALLVLGATDSRVAVTVAAAGSGLLLAGWRGLFPHDSSLPDLSGCLGGAFVVVLVIAGTTVPGTHGAPLVVRRWRPRARRLRTAGAADGRARARELVPRHDGVRGTRRLTAPTVYDAGPLSFLEFTCTAYCLPCSSVTTTLSAQTKTIPAFAADIEGNSLHAYPLGFTQVRNQILIDGKAISSGSRVLRGFAFRADGGGSTTSFAKKSLKPKITVYTVTTTASAMSKTWATNIGTATAPSSTTRRSTYRLGRSNTRYRTLGCPRSLSTGPGSSTRRSATC